MFLVAYVLLFVSSEIMTCTEHNFNSNKIAQPLSFLIAGSQVLNVYALLFWRSDEVIKTLDGLQEIIGERMSNK